MNHADHNKIVFFIWSIADDYLSDKLKIKDLDSDKIDELL